MLLSATRGFVRRLRLTRTATASCLTAFPVPQFNAAAAAAVPVAAAAAAVALSPALPLAALFPLPVTTRSTAVAPRANVRRVAHVITLLGAPRCLALQYNHARAFSARVAVRA